MVRIGFVGAGLIAWAHALGIKAMIDAGELDAAITAVHDPRPRAPQALVETVGAPGAESVDDATAVAARADVVYVCTPTAAHRAAVDEALAAGRAIFCEKPLDLNLARATALVDAVGGAAVLAQSGLVLRSAPVTRGLKDIIDRGTLGEPMAAVFRDDQFFPIKGHYASQWRGDVNQAGGGCLIEHSIHDVDILRFCFGEVDRVAARTANHAGHEGVEDLATVQMTHASGFESHLISLWHDIMSRGSTRRIEVFCREGMVTLANEFRGPLRIQTNDGTEERFCPSPQWVDDLPMAHDEIGIGVRAYVEADRNFLDAVLNGTPPEPGLDVALVAHRLVDAAYRSAALGGDPIDLRRTASTPIEAATQG